MKRHIWLPVVVLLLIVSSLTVVGWPYIKAGMRYATGSRMVELAKREHDAATPGTLFIQVVSNSHEPIGNAKVTFHITEPNYPEIYDSGGWSRDRTITEVTDQNGVISLNEGKVISIQVQDVSLPDYVWMRPTKSNRTGTREYEVYPTFNYSYATAPPVGMTPQENVHQPDPDDPYILRMERIED